MTDVRRRTDTRAVRDVLSGQRNSYGTLVERYQSLVYHVALAHVGNPSDAEDLTQDAFLKAFHSLDTLRDAKKFSAWIVTITRNACRDFLKRRSVRAEHTKTLEEPEPQEPPFEAMETRRALWRHIDQLEETQRELLVLHHFEGKSARELAALYNISTSACAKRLQRARQTLGAEMLKTLGLTVERDEPKDVSKRVLGLIATVPVTWESAAAATVGSTGGAAFAGIGLSKIGVAILSVAAVIVGALLITGNEETEIPHASIVESVPPEGMEIAKLESETATEPGSAVSSRVVDTESGIASMVEKGPVQSTPSFAKGGVIAGRVYDAETGVGLIGAEVEATIRMEGRRISKMVETDASGFYEILSLQTGEYAVNRGDLDGYPSRNTNEQKQIIVKTESRYLGVDFVLQRGLAVVGEVRDADGFPVADALVRTIDNAHFFDSKPTEEDGSFTLLGFKAQQKFIIQAVKDDLISKPQGPFVIASDGFQGIVLVLEPQGSITGRLLDMNRKPLAGKPIGVIPEVRDVINRTNWGTTDGEGRFSIAGLCAGSYDIVSAPRGADLDFPNAITLKNVAVEPGQQIANLELTLDDDAGLVIAGRVVNEKGKPLARADVFLDGSTRAFTDKGGYYRFHAVEEGVHRVLVLKAGYTGLWQRDIQAGDGNVDLVLRRSGQIEGVVVRADTGAPVAEFSVSNILGTRARMTPALSENATHIHDEQGRFSLTDVEQGEVTVAIMASGFATTFQTVEVELGEAPATLVVVRLEPESVVHGRVVDKSAQPIAGVLIGVGKIPRDESGCVRDALTRTDDDGAFQLDGQGPSETIVWAFHPNYVSESTAFAPAQRRGNDIEMVLRRGAIIEGAVRKGGRTAVGASISADNRKFTQQSDGTYRLSGLSPGLLSVRAQFGDPAGHIGYFTMEKQVLVESGDTAQVNFDFIEGNAEIEVYLTAEGQTPRRAEVIVTLWSENGEKILCRVNEYNTDYCRLSGLPAGRLSLEVKVSAVSGTEYKRVIEVDSQAGYTTTLELGLPDEVRTKARDQ